MRYLLLLFALISFSACDNESFSPILDLDQIEGVWQGNWTTDNNGGSSEISVQFTTVSRMGTFQDVPFNTLGYREAEITFRYLTLNNTETNAIEGEMLVKYEDASRNAWMPVQIASFYPSLIVSVDCFDCVNSTIILERQ